jgi:hypothetical protein
LQEVSQLTAHVSQLLTERRYDRAMVYSMAFRMKTYMEINNMHLDLYEERKMMKEALMNDFPDITAAGIKDVMDKIYIPKSL